MLSPSSHAGSFLFLPSSLYPQESLILLFVPLEHLHINPFFLRRHHLWSGCFAVQLCPGGEQRSVGDEDAVQLQPPRGPYPYTEQSKPGISLFLSNASILLSPSEHSAVPLPSAVSGSCRPHASLPSSHGPAPACVSSEAAWVRGAAHLPICPHSNIYIDIYNKYLWLQMRDQV